jgi:hypothetical protein
MQSANGQVEQSVGLAQNVAFRFDGVTFHLYAECQRASRQSTGLARNVAFRFNGVTLYLQVHIIRNPAYKVLLCRPFEVPTKLAAANSADGSQLLTLTDPNTQRRCVVPTFKRGPLGNSRRSEILQLRLRMFPLLPRRSRQIFRIR